MSTVYKASRGALMSDAIVAVVMQDLSVYERTAKANSGSDLTIKAGTILGTILFGTPTSAAGGSNTGNGTMGSVALKDLAQEGDYDFECIATATNAGTFAVFDPAGNRLEDCTVGVAYDNGQIGCTIADGATDFAVGDTFTVTVPEGSLQVVPLSLTAVDGSQRASGVAARETFVPDGVNTPINSVEKLATLKSTGLVYPSGATTAQKAKADEQLAARHLKKLSAA